MSASQTTTNPIAAEHYGSKTVAVEPGGIDQIPDSERHGSPIQLLTTWTSPNLEFATIAVGILGVLYWGLSLWQALAAIVLGTALGSISLGVLSTWGPPSGMCQMVLSRTGFGVLGNVLPAGLNAVVAGIGWFAVNSISGALALHALFGALPNPLCLLIVVAAQLTIAFFGHNLVHVFERYAFPVLVLVFVVGAVVILSKAHPGLRFPDKAPPTVGGFLLMTGAAFGYAAGWNPYSADYTRYLPRTSSRAAVAGYSALGVFVSCVLLETAGAAMVSAASSPDVNPGIYTALLPTWLGKLTLLCIAIGAIAANALKVYSGAMSFLAMGVRLRLHSARAVVAVVFGVLGFLLALTGLGNAGGNYEAFLLVISYWIGPWLGVVLTDRILRRGTDIDGLLTDRGWTNWAGPVAMGVAMVVSIWLFSNQEKYVGVLPKAHPNLGDITFLVGFLLAASIYPVIFRMTGGGVSTAERSSRSRVPA